MTLDRKGWLAVLTVDLASCPHCGGTQWTTHYHSSMRKDRGYRRAPRLRAVRCAKCRDTRRLLDALGSAIGPSFERRPEIVSMWRKTDLGHDRATAAIARRRAAS